MIILFLISLNIITNVEDNGKRDWRKYRDNEINSELDNEEEANLATLEEEFGIICKDV